MNRRDLLLLRPNARVVELSCEQLFLQHLELRRRAASSSREVGDRENDWLGEPEPDYAERDDEDLFGDLARRIAGADVLRIVGPDRLGDLELAQRVNRLAEEFAMRGGRVERVPAKLFPEVAT